MAGRQTPKSAASNKHGGPDGPRALALTAYLAWLERETTGSECWSRGAPTPWGEPCSLLAEKMKRNIAACDAFVVLLTHNTANSSYVHQEIGCALTAKKLVIPLVQPGIGSEQLAMLAGVEYIEFDFENPHAGVEGFAAAIRRVAEKQRKQQDVEALIAIALCMALLVMLLSDGGGGMAVG